MRHRSWALISLCFVAGGNSVASSAQNPPSKPLGQTAMQTEYLLKLKTTLKAEDRKKLFKKYTFQEVQKVGSTELYLIRVSSKLSLKEIQDKIKNESTISYIERNTMYHTQKGTAPNPTE